MLSNVVVAFAVFLHALELPSMCKGQALQWQVNKTTEIIFGETEMELICSGTACCTGTVREWTGGSGSTTLMSNGVSSDSSKYEETLKSDSFSLVFKTLELTDVNTQYECSIDFASSTSTLLLPTADVFRYVPDVNNEIEIEKNVTESKINLRANLTRVFPEPVCTAKLKETDLTSSLTMTTNDNSPVKFTVIEMSNVPYQCSNIQEFLVISCKVGTIPFTVVNEEICQSTDSCDFNYWNCIGYILAAVYISAGIYTLVDVVWWKTKRKEIKAKSITCWLADHRFCCCGQHIFCCCSQKVNSLCERYKTTRIWGARVLLLTDVFVIGMIVSIVVWFFAVFIVIFTYCTCKEQLEKLIVAVLSLLLSLFASAFWTALVLMVYRIASCCRNSGCVGKQDNRITKEAGEDVNFLEKRSHEFKRIKSIDLTKDDTPVSPDEYEVEMTAVPSLTLKMVSLDQSGMYECTICYDLTKKEVHQLNLLVTPKQYEVKMGDRKTLLKYLKNLNGIIDVKWTHNNKAIPADSSFYKGGTQSNPSLTVKYCSTRDSGLYICNIRTTSSTKRFSAQLKTKDKYTVDSGKNIDLLKDLSSCRDVRTISWKLNGNPLDLVDNPAYIGGTKDCPALNVLCATKQESGKYKCTLVLESPPAKELQFTLDLNEQLQVDSGESIVLLDQLGNSNNVSSVEWTHKKRPVTCFHKGGIIQCPALTIPVVSNEDSGEYNCKITLKQGNKRFYRFVVKVNVQKIKKKVGDRVVLLQNLKSAGTIQEIDWYKNGQKVEAGKDEKYQGGVNQSPGLLVGSLKEQDSGLYKCDLIVKESQIKLHILVDLTVEQEENSTRLGPIIGHNRVRNHENTENNQSWTEEEQ